MVPMRVRLLYRHRYNEIWPYRKFELPALQGGTKHVQTSFGICVDLIWQWPLCNKEASHERTITRLDAGKPGLQVCLHTNKQRTIGQPHMLRLIVPNFWRRPNENRLRIFLDPIRDHLVSTYKSHVINSGKLYLFHGQLSDISCSGRYRDVKENI